MSREESTLSREIRLSRYSSEFAATLLIQDLIDVVLGYLFMDVKWELTMEKLVFKSTGIGWIELFKCGSETVSPYGTVELYHQNEFHLFEKDSTQLAKLHKASCMALVVRPFAITPLSYSQIFQGALNVGVELLLNQRKIKCFALPTKQYLIHWEDDEDDHDGMRNPPNLASISSAALAVDYCGQFHFVDQLLDSIIFYLNSPYSPD